MSLKPDKKSDKGKRWMSPRKDGTRKIKIPYHLVVTEGTKTEPNYFFGLKNAVNGKDGLEKVHLEISGEGMNTVSLMARAKQLARSAGNPYQHIWIVYDKDDFPAENFNSVVDLCRTATEESGETEYHAIWSNQCVELWFLLHFSYFHSDISRDEYYPKLTQHLEKISCGGYRKNRDDIFTVLLPKLPDAIKNAEKLECDNIGKSPALSAPGTQLHTMMKEFLPYLDNLKA